MAHRKAAFTLIETLVTITVIGVLLSIALPALQSVRRSASAASCRSNLRTIGQFYGLYAADHNDEWPNIMPKPDGTTHLDPQAPPLDIDWGHGHYLVWPGAQIGGTWAWPLRVYLPGEGPEHDPVSYSTENGDSGLGSVVRMAIETFSCPFVVASNTRSPTYLNPVAMADRSFWFSAALFTRADVWNEGGPPPDLNDVTAIVHHADVASPSRKAALVERHTHHTGSPWAPVEDAAGGAVNVLAADAHVETVPVTEAHAPMTFTHRWAKDPSFHIGVAIPFVSTRDGFRGVDW